jgi:hypothetical protein
VNCEPKRACVSGSTLWRPDDEIGIASIQKCPTPLAHQAAPMLRMTATGTQPSTGSELPRRPSVGRTTGARRSIFSHPKGARYPAERDRRASQSQHSCCPTLSLTTTPTCVVPIIDWRTPHFLGPKALIGAGRKARFSEQKKAGRASADSVVGSQAPWRWGSWSYRLRHTLGSMRSDSRSLQGCISDSSRP